MERIPVKPITLTILPINNVQETVPIPDFNHVAVVPTIIPSQPRKLGTQLSLEEREAKRVASQKERSARYNEKIKEYKKIGLLKSEKERIIRVKYRYIVGYKFFMLDCMNIRLDQSTNSRSTTLTHQIHHVKGLEMLQIIAENKADDAMIKLTYKDWYSRIVPKRLPENHAIDMKDYRKSNNWLVVTANINCLSNPLVL